MLLLLLLLSRFSRVQLCVTPQTAAHQAPVPGILQARTLEWVAISFSNAWKWKVKVKSLTRVQLSATPWTAAYQAPLSMGFSRQEYWSGMPSPSPPSMLKTGKSISLTSISAKLQTTNLPEGVTDNWASPSQCMQKWPHFCFYFFCNQS